MLASRTLAALALSGFAGSLMPMALPQPAVAQGLPGLTLRWNGNEGGFKELKYILNSGRTNALDTWMMILPGKELDVAAIQVSVTYPAYFAGRFDNSAVKLKLCNAGGVLARTRCEEDVPLSSVEIDRDNGRIDFFPAKPIPAGTTVGVVFDSMINPSNPGMLQFNASIISPGDLPLSKYVGSWLITIENN